MSSLNNPGGNGPGSGNNQPVNPPYIDPTNPNPSGPTTPATSTTEPEYYISFKDGVVYFGKTNVTTSPDGRRSISNSNEPSAWFRGTYTNVQGGTVEIMFTHISKGNAWLPFDSEDTDVKAKKADALNILKRYALNTVKDVVTDYNIVKKPTKYLLLTIQAQNGVDMPNASAWEPVSNADCLYNGAPITSITSGGSGGY